MVTIKHIWRVNKLKREGEVDKDMEGSGLGKFVPTLNEKTAKDHNTCFDKVQL